MPKRNRILRAIGRTLPRILLFFSASLPFSCMAPARAPEKPPEAAEPSIPYQSIAASLAVGNPEGALAAYDAALKQKPEARETRILHARLLMVAGKLDEAREELALLLAEDGRDAGVLYSLSVIEGLEGNSEGQKDLLSKAAAIDPSNADVLAALGDLALQDKDRNAAAGYFTRALESQADNFTALLGQGTLLLDAKDYKNASEALSKAIGVQPDYPFSYVDRARARQSLGDDAGAIQDLSQAIRIDPGYSWSYIDRGKLYLRTSKQDLALEDFSMAIEIDPGNFVGYAIRAELLYRRKAYDQALADYRTCVELRPDYQFAYEPLGVLAFMKADWETSRKYFLEAFRYDEGELSYPLMAALALRKAGKAQAAADFLRSALERFPQGSWSLETARFLIDPVSSGFSMSGRTDRERDKAARARMLFYLAEQYFIDGKVRPAESCLLEIENAGSPGAVETRLAEWELSTRTAKE